VGDAVWAKSFGGTVSAQILATAIDSTGAPIVAGIFSGPLQLGSTQATCPGDTGQSCAFVAKLGAGGAVTWAKAFVGDGQSYFYETLLAVGPSDEIVVAGGYFGAVDFGQGLVGGDGERFVFLSRYDSGGHLAANLHYLCGGNVGSFASANGVVVQANGDVVLLGSAPGQVDFGSGPVSGAFLVDVQPNGVPAWTKQLDNVAEDSGNNPLANAVLARTSVGDLILGGATTGSADLGCGALAPDQAFVAGLDASGACRFQNGYPGAHVDAIASDPTDDSVTVAGFLQGGTMLTIGPDALTSQGNYDALVFHLGTAGEELWGKNFGSSGATTFAFGVCVEPSSGGIGLAGYAGGLVDFGGGNLAGSGTDFAAVFDQGGAFRWAGHFGQGSGATGCGFTASNRLVFVGEFGGTMGFPSRVIQSNGTSSGFAAELAVP
jgi:hypothetical protein